MTKHILQNLLIDIRMPEICPTLILSNRITLILNHRLTNGSTWGHSIQKGLFCFSRRNEQKQVMCPTSHRVLQSILTPSFLYKEEDTQSSSQTSIWPASRAAEICFYSSCLLCLIGKIQFKTLVLLLLLATVRGEHCKSSMQQTYVCTITFRMWKKPSSNRESNPTTTRTQLLTFQKIEMVNNGLHIIF